MYELPVGNDDGSALLTFERMAEGDLRGLDPCVPLTASLVALWCDGRCLLVFNRFRQAWELPGGMLDPGETPRQAALRELAEESGQHPDSLGFVAAARVRVAPDQRLEYLAIYSGRVTAPAAFTPNDEMSAAMWWRPVDEPTGILPIDAALAEFCAD